MIKKRSDIFIILFCLLFAFFQFSSVLAQTSNLTASNERVNANSEFSLVLTIDSVSDLFGVAFDLDFDPSLVSYIDVDEGTFLSEGCQTSLMTAENPPGKLIVGLTRLGSSCGGVSGSGALMTFHFQSLSQEGISNFTFSNNSLCILSGGECDYITGAWQGDSVIIAQRAGIADLNIDGRVDSSDFSQLIGKWDMTQDITEEDFNYDFVVDARDLGVLMSNWTN